MSELARRGPPTETALLTDLYELTMLQAYHAEGMDGRAVFSLFIRDLPPERRFLIAAGLEPVLDYLESLSFSSRAIEHLASLRQFDERFLEWLSALRFTGDVRAMPEGTVVFGNEPLLEVEAPIGEAQVVETFLLNQITFQTLIASKGARSVIAAAGRTLIDFGTRRTHGVDAALGAARALYIAGVDATSNVEAGRRYGIPAVGTMAHSYVQAHESERAAFEAFSSQYPGTTLLVDTYDTLEGVREVVRLHAERGPEFHVRAVRLDSGDLAELAKETRSVLDAAGLTDVRIVASGGLDEYAIASLIEAAAPIDTFAIGTRVGTSADQPTLDSAYKLVSYEGVDRLKFSTGKATLPGPKQVYRDYRDGIADGDVIARVDEAMPGEPLLRTVMRNGRREPDACPPLEDIRRRAAEQMSALPAHLRSLDPARERYPVAVSEGLRAAAERRRGSRDGS